MRFFLFFSIFDGVIMDGHPIFRVVDADVAVSTTIKILDANPL